MSCVYILFSQKKNRFYTGSSRDDIVDERLKRHNAGCVTSTKSGMPWTCIHVEIHNTYTEARKRELFLKTGVGRKELNERFGSLKMNLRRDTQEAEGGRLLIS